MNFDRRRTAGPGGGGGLLPRGALRCRQALVPLLLLTVGCATGSGGTDLARREIAAVIDEGIDASRRGDVAAFVARLPADFTVELPNGRTASRADVEKAHLGRLRSKAETLALTIGIERLEVRGVEATVWTLQRWERRVTPPGETRSYVILTTQRHEERWRRRNGRWEPYRIRELGGDAFIDGVRQPPRGGPGT